MKASSANPDLPQPHMTVEAVLQRWPGLATVFVRRKMACPGCAMAPYMSLDDAADAYEIDADELLFDLHQALGAA
jgi:hybrid cluster-associated redox disulfide protein